jgi:hypothetical protein
MPALLELQRSFAASLLSGSDHAIGQHILEDGFSASERLRIHRNTCRSTLIETMRMTYPAVDRLVGREFFDMAADTFVLAHPAGSGYLNEYGGGFADFLADFHRASSIPYLPDVARFEWALGVAANAEDAPVLGADALVAFQPQHQGALCFEPHPSVSVLLLAYPADQIADAVLSGDEAAMAEVDLASGPVRLVVHRGAAGLEPQRLEPRAYEFVCRLCAGEPLGRLIDIAPDQAAALLAEQLIKGRLSAVRIAQ